MFTCERVTHRCSHGSRTAPAFLRVNVTHTHTHTHILFRSCHVLQARCLRIRESQWALLCPTRRPFSTLRSPPPHLPTGSRFLTPCHAPPCARVTASPHSCCGSFGLRWPTRLPSFAWKTCYLSISSQLSHHFLREAFFDLPE